MLRFRLFLSPSTLLDARRCLRVDVCFSLWLGAPLALGVLAGAIALGAAFLFLALADVFPLPFFCVAAICSPSVSELGFSLYASTYLC